MSSIDVPSSSSAPSSSPSISPSPSPSSIITPGASFATDHFSGATQQYRTFRPSYPNELFEYFHSLMNKQKQENEKETGEGIREKNNDAMKFAIDAGTGNGQAAISLAKYFDRVYAFDPSKSLIESAIHADRVHYFVAEAENFLSPLQSLHSSIPNDQSSSVSSLPSSLINNVSLIISATAAHWFDLSSFYSSCDSLLSSNNGILAIFAYGYHSIASNDQAEKISHEFSQQTLLPYWPPQIQYIIHQYRDIPFPLHYEKSFLEKYGPPPSFFIRTEMTADELIGYMFTWSGTRRFLDGSNNDDEKKNNHLIWENVKERLKCAWKKGKDGKEGMGKESIVLPIHLRIGLKTEKDHSNAENASQ